MMLSSTRTWEIITCVRRAEGGGLWGYDGLLLRYDCQKCCRGFETLLLKVACGSANKAQHEAGLRGFGYAFGEVIGTKDVLKMID